MDLSKYVQAVNYHMANHLSKALVALQLFPRADIPRFRILENPTSVPKSTILIDQDVSYFRDPNASEPTKVSNSVQCPHTCVIDHALPAC